MAQQYEISFIGSPRNDKEWAEYYQLRFIQLREPWGHQKGCEKTEEDDIGQPKCYAYGLWVKHVDTGNNNTTVADTNNNNNDNVKLVACARLDRYEQDNNTTAQIRCVATDPYFQGAGYGSILMQAIENDAKTKYGFKSIFLNARFNAVKFYLKLGYVLQRKSFYLWDSIQHYEMYKALHFQEKQQEQQEQQELNDFQLKLYCLLAAAPPSISKDIANSTMDMILSTRNDFLQDSTHRTK